MDNYPSMASCVQRPRRSFADMPRGAQLMAWHRLDDRPQRVLPHRRHSFEIVISLSVMNSNNAGWPSLVAAIPRSMADRMSAGSVIRSP